MISREHLILFILNEEKFANIKMSDIVSFKPHSSSLSFVETVETWLYKSNLPEKILEAFGKAMKKIAYHREREFPQEDYDYILSYLNKKLLRCKEGGPAHKETAIAICDMLSKNFNLLNTNDSNIMYKARNLRDYSYEATEHLKYLRAMNDLEENKKYLDMTLSEIIKEFK